MSAASVIPAPIVYIKVVVDKKAHSWISTISTVAKSFEDQQISIKSNGVMFSVILTQIQYQYWIDCLITYLIIFYF